MTEESNVAKSIRLVAQKIDDVASAAKRKFLEVEEILEGFRQEIDQLKVVVGQLQERPAPTTSVSSSEIEQVLARMTALENEINALKSTPSTPAVGVPPSTSVPSSPPVRPMAPKTPPMAPPTAPPSSVSPSPPPSAGPRPTVPVTAPPTQPRPTSTPSKPEIPATPEAPAKVATPAMPAMPPKREAAPPKEVAMPTPTDDETKSLMDALKKLESI